MTIPHGQVGKGYVPTFCFLLGVALAISAVLIFGRF